MESWLVPLTFEVTLEIEMYSIFWYQLYLHAAKKHITFSLNSKEWKGQSSLEWLLGSIEKIDISIYKEWK